MSLTTAESLVEQLQWRYAVKKFDATKVVSEKDWNALEQALVLSASSFGLQPWQFIVVKDRAVREQLVPHSWGQRQVADCSHLVVFAALNQITEGFVKEFVDQIVAVRGGDRKKLEGYEQMMVNSVVKGRSCEQQQEWAARQVYLALGNLLTSTAVLGIDSCPLEGIVPEKYDEILGLADHGAHTVCACAVGYRHAEDVYAKAEKVRFAAKRVIRTI